MRELFCLGEAQHGRGAVAFLWQPQGDLVASCGTNGLVQIRDRHGESYSEVRLGNSAAVTMVDWDRDGQILAILQDRIAEVSLYDVKSKRLTTLDTGLKDPRVLAWSKIGPQLAIGAGNGTLIMYRKDNLRQETFVGKHSGAITCAVWNKETNKLALAGDDKVVTISLEDGATEEQFSTSSKPSKLQFSPQNKKGTSQWLLSVCIKNESLAFIESHRNAATPIAFASKYGKIVTYEWLASDIIVVGFSTGQVAAINVADKQVLGQEIFIARLHRTSLSDLVVSRSLQRVATCGDSSVRLLDTESWKELKSDSLSFDSEQGNLSKMQWTTDAQILSVSTKTGTIFSFLSKVPQVHSAQGTSVAFLSSLREISVVNALDAQQGVRCRPLQVPVNVEPSFIALGHGYLAAGVNNQVCFYKIEDATDEQCPIVNEQEYLTKVDDIRLNESHCAALCAGRIYLHPIENELEGSQTKILPAPECGDATCVALTSHFLIFGTVDGTIEFYSFRDDQMLAASAYKHRSGAIRRIFPDIHGTRVIFIDESGSGFLYNPLDSQVTEIPEFNKESRLVLWDGLDSCIFAVADPQELSTYVYSPLTINGPEISKVGPLEVLENGDIHIEPLSTQIPAGFEAITMFAGIVTCQNPASELARVMLGSHEALHSMEHTQDANKARFEQSLALRKLRDAWHMAIKLESRQHWLALSGRAMEEMDMELALRIWRQLGDAGMVMALEQLRFVEDKHLLAGSVAALFGDYAQAQELYLLSPAPERALEMRKDLFHWDQALKIAESVAPEEIPVISVEYAKQLEFKGEYKQALEAFQNAASSFELQMEEKRQDDNEQEQQYIAACRNGIARMTLRVGNIPKGVGLAMNSDDRGLQKECADILVSLKQFPDAATLYEKAGECEEAASIYIKAKNFAAAQPLLAKVSTPKLHLQFARAREMEKDYRTAAQGYEKGNDLDSVIRLSLNHLGQPDKAFALVRQHQSPEGAEMAARYCEGVSNFQGAIEFLLMAKKSSEAFELAMSHDTMEAYETALGANGAPEEYANVAKYYESKQEWSKAAEFYAICGKHHKALKLYLQCDEIEKAIEVVGRARSDVLTHTLIDHLTGTGPNAPPKAPVHIFRLYMALGNFLQAASTAMVIAIQEREQGNYKSAHATLYETLRELEARSLKIPSALKSEFLLLHSYLLAKKRIKVGDHPGAARLLCRVAKSISKFPAHIVPILTSTVIECQRAGLKKTAFQYASRLMQPEHRGDLQPNYRKKIEAIVRHSAREELEDAEQGRSRSPYSGDMLEDFELVCPRTKNQIPFCIVTGRHMVLEDWCICPNSKMPALFSMYVEYLESFDTEEERVDPVCGRSISVQELKRMEDPTEYLKAFQNNSDEETN